MHINASRSVYCTNAPSFFITNLISNSRSPETKINFNKNIDENEELEFRNGSLRLKMIIIFHVPKRFLQEQVESKLTRILGITKTTHSQGILKFMKPMTARNDKMHIPDTLPEPLANHLVKTKTVCCPWSDQ